MQEPMRPWTLEKLGNLDDREFELLWFATFGGPPAAILDRREMERIFIEYDNDPAWPQLTF